MTISVSRMGGSEGTSESICDLDTKAMDRMLAERVRRMVKQVSFFDLPAKPTASNGGETYSFEITVTEGTRTHTVAFPDDEDPENRPLREFVEALEEIE
jgi:hypothetical protein